MSKFTFKIYIPSLEKTYRFGEIPNFVFKDFTKALLNEDVELFESLMDDYFREYSNAEFKLLTPLDKSIIMMELYSLCVRDVIDLRLEDGMKYTMIVSGITKSLFDIKYIRLVDVDGFGVIIGPPRKNITGDISIHSYIHAIKRGEDVVTITNEDDQLKIYDRIGTKINQHVIEYINEINDKLSNIKLVFTTIGLKVNDVSLLYAMLFLYKHSISDYYDILYILSREANMQQAYLESLTFGELLILLAKHKKHSKTDEGETNGDRIPTHKHPVGSADYEGVQMGGDDEYDGTSDFSEDL